MLALQVYSLTNVPPARQRLFGMVEPAAPLPGDDGRNNGAGRGGALLMDAETVPVKDGATIALWPLPADDDKSSGPPQDGVDPVLSRQYQAACEQGRLAAVCSRFPSTPAQAAGGMLSRLQNSARCGAHQ